MCSVANDSYFVGVRPIVQELLERGRNRRGVDDPLRDSLGYSLSLWNGASSDEQAISILFRCGVFAINVGNSVVLSLPTDHQAGEESFDFEVVRRQIIALVRHFAPDWGVANSHAAAQAFSSERTNMPKAGWLTYLRNHLAQIPLVHNFEFETIGTTGSLLIATKETFCAANERHMASVAAVADWLAQVVR
jgi:immunity protein 52 of polymorphic toxin system